MTVVRIFYSFGVVSEMRHEVVCPCRVSQLVRVLGTYESNRFVLTLPSLLFVCARRLLMALHGCVLLKCH